MSKYLISSIHLPNKGIRVWGSRTEFSYRSMRQGKMVEVVFSLNFNAVISLARRWIRYTNTRTNRWEHFFKDGVLCVFL
jgi:hypothetical protein